MRLYHPIHPHKTQIRVAIGLILIAMAIMIFVLTYEHNVRPIVEQAALYAVTDAVTKRVNTVVERKISEGMLDYNSLVTVVTDNNGEISALITNMAGVNLLQTNITDEVIDSITDNFLTDLKIPLGNIIASSVFYGKGPLIPVTLKSVTNVSAEFENEFTSAGINQTKHQINLNISVQVCVLIPGTELKQTVKTSVPVAQTVIVGHVPEYYGGYRGT